MGKNKTVALLFILLLCGAFKVSPGCPRCTDQRWLCVFEDNWRSCERVCMYVIYGQEDRICQHLCRFEGFSNAPANMRQTDASECLDQRWLCQHRDDLSDCERVCMHDLYGLDRTWQRLCRMVDDNYMYNGSNGTTDTGDVESNNIGTTGSPDAGNNMGVLEMLMQVRCKQLSQSSRNY